MAEVRCVFRAHYKTRGMGFYDIGQFEAWLPEKDAMQREQDRINYELEHPLEVFGF